MIGLEERGVIFKYRVIKEIVSERCQWNNKNIICPREKKSVENS